MGQVAAWAYGGDDDMTRAQQAEFNEKLMFILNEVHMGQSDIRVSLGKLETRQLQIIGGIEIVTKAPLAPIARPDLRSEFLDAINLLERSVQRIQLQSDQNLVDIKGLQGQSNMAKGAMWAIRIVFVVGSALIGWFMHAK